MADQDPLEQALAALKAGDRTRACAILAKFVQAYPQHEQAWLLLARCLDERAKRDYCLRRVLELNPGNLDAQKMMAGPVTPEAGRPVDSVAPVVSARPTQKPPAAPPARPKSWLRRNGALAAAGGLTALILIGLPVLYFVLVNLRQAQAGPLTAAALPTLTAGPALEGSPTETVQASATPPPTETPTRAPTSTATPPADYQTRLVIAQPMIAEAKNLMSLGQYPQAVEAWSGVLKILPEYADGYYQRAMSYWHQNDAQNVFSEYERLLRLAMPDFDRAIALNPENGDYYYWRGKGYRSLGNIYHLRIDETTLNAIALENSRAAMALGSTIAFFEREVPIAMNEMGACKEGLAEAERQQKAQQNEPPSSTINETIARSYMCLGQYEKALEYMDRAIKVKPTCQLFMMKGVVLMGLQRNDEALRVLDGCIENSPEYGGYRYYLRGLLEYDQGKKDQAEQDLMVGAGNTFYHDGIFDYLLGLLTFDKGKLEEATRLFQQAEMTMMHSEGPALLKRVQDDMARRGIPTILPTSELALTVTPIAPEILSRVAPTRTPGPTITSRPAAANQPAPTDRPAAQAPTKDPNVAPDGAVDAIQVEAEIGTGPLVLKSGNYPLFHYVPKSPVNVKLARKVTFTMLPDNGGPAPDIQVYLFARGGGWRMIEPVWGVNEIEFPSFYVGPQGDFYFAIRNWGEATVQIENAGFSFVVIRDDDTPYSYGLKP